MHAWNKTVWWPCKSLVHYDIPVDGHVERLRLEVRSKLINLYTFTGSRRPTCSCASAPMRPRPPERSLWPSCRGWASTSLFLRSSLLLLQWLLSLSRGVYGLTCWFTTVRLLIRQNWWLHHKIIHSVTYQLQTVWGKKEKMLSYTKTKLCFSQMQVLTSQYLVCYYTDTNMRVHLAYK